MKIKILSPEAYLDNEYICFKKDRYEDILRRQELFFKIAEDDDLFENMINQVRLKYPNKVRLIDESVLDYYDFFNSTASAYRVELNTCRKRDGSLKENYTTIIADIEEIYEKFVLPDYARLSLFSIIVSGVAILLPFSDEVEVVGANQISDEDDNKNNFYLKLNRNTSVKALKKSIDIFKQSVGGYLNKISDFPMFGQVVNIDTYKTVYRLKNEGLDSREISLKMSEFRVDLSYKEVIDLLNKYKRLKNRIRR